MESIEQFGKHGSDLSMKDSMQALDLGFLLQMDVFPHLPS